MDIQCLDPKLGMRCPDPCQLKANKAFIHASGVMSHASFCSRFASARRKITHAFRFARERRCPHRHLAITSRGL